jgi:ABC-type sugar transport system ATPase subunit
MRICVMFQGRIVAELSRQDASEESILGFATGLAAETRAEAGAG